MKKAVTTNVVTAYVERVAQIGVCWDVPPSVTRFARATFPSVGEGQFGLPT